MTFKSRFAIALSSPVKESCSFTNSTRTFLHAAGFVLDQSPQLEDIDLDTVRAPARTDGTPPRLGPYRTYQVPIVDIIDLTGLNLAALSEADVGTAPSLVDSKG